MNNKFFFIVFLLIFFLFFGSCVNSQSQDDFYLALQLKSDKDKIDETVKLFEKALSNSNKYIRQAAADEIAILMSEGTAISDETSFRIRSEVSPAWAAALEAADSLPDIKKAIDFFLKSDQLPDEAVSHVMNECERQRVIFNEIESAVINAHFAVSGLRYNEALMLFRVLTEDGNWPLMMPQIFVDYPVLINDLGRAFQYTVFGSEGLSLFLGWDQILRDASGRDDLRYRLLFMAARIARRSGLRGQAISLFEQALPLAPDSLQEDASLWYALDLSLSETRDFFHEKLKRSVPLWNDGNYFNDILERFLQTLVTANDWRNIIETFNVIKDSAASAKAAYAWVIACLIEEGFLSEEEMALASEAESAEAVLFAEIAYNALENDVSSLLYYRAVSAPVCGKHFLDIDEGVKDEKHSDAAQFLLGFSKYEDKLASSALKYILQFEQEFSPAELRIAASILEQMGMYPQSIRFVTRFINREGSYNRQDLELLFPRPFLELVETYASETGIPPQIMFALIRTESAFQSDVISRAGAAGLTQLMADTAREMADRLRRAGGPDYTAEELDLTDPQINIHIGAFYLNYLTGRFENNMLLSLLSYNGGMNRVRRWRNASSLPEDLFLETIPYFETRDYGRKVLSAAAVYEYLYYK